MLEGADESMSVEDDPERKWVDAMPTAPGHVHLSLMRGFQLSQDDHLVVLPLGAQRLIAFLALQNRPVLRVFVAGNLWLDKPGDVACGSLRSALWQLRRCGLEIVDATHRHLQLSASLYVDVREILTHAHQLIEGTCGALSQQPHTLFTGELLPDWYEDWVIVERERIRQLRLHALEAMGLHLIEQGLTIQAIEAGLAAVAADPLRESSHRLVISAHLAEGNRSEALRQYEVYAQLLDENLGLEPSERMAALIGSMHDSTRHLSRGLPVRAG
jgi:DNA-binding SARP family transcriptional activator